MSIELIIGPMFSGKTTELMRKINRYILSNQKCVIITHNIDNRFINKNIINHDGNILNKEYLYIKTNNLINEINIVDNYDIIGIDECQFFEENDLEQFCDKMANNKKKVIVAGLNCDFNRNIFNSISKLIPKVEKIKKLQAICQFCYKDASFTIKKHNKNQIIEIGGQDLYVPVCRLCYNNSY
ncbi:thymidine kinase [Betaentomopoxvirus amoorei]|uniref:Thymidine kinase n=1 Tax=Amsacta moorei entomopoxvirus TaxID=28321 RepID=KITH_AMEPV|nr:thymidine kinase [Amsacta moorei entomopoxvirus]P28852.1 RecName: Full=Thymidine kinase [Amsacta moorei entomopoxvirus]AAA42386.1 thymidine kinase [unidentified entomopoxvirus]AAG02722.1 AMV016 [Amsacta moorei entomopoxvirus]BAA01525.1 thymidine kinase [Amsacta moorei entomopoxvirus]